MNKKHETEKKFKDKDKEKNQDKDKEKDKESNRDKEKDKESNKDKDKEIDQDMSSIKEQVVIIPCCVKCGLTGTNESIFTSSCPFNHQYCFSCLYRHFILNINEILTLITNKKIINFKCLSCESKEECGTISIPFEDFISKQQVYYTNLTTELNTPLQPCPIHNTPYNNYCSSCNTYICKYCEITEHKDHKIESIFEKENQIKSKLSSLPIKRSATFLESLKEMNNKNISAFEDILTRTLSEIDKLTIALNQLKLSFEDKMNQLKKQYEGIEEIINQTYSNYYSQITSLDSNVSIPIPYLYFLNEINEEFKEIKFTIAPTVYQDIQLMKGKINELSQAEKISSTAKFSFSFDKIREYSCIKTIKEHSDYIRNIVISDRKLFTCSDDKLIKVYDMDNDFKVIQTLKGHTDAINVLLLVNPNKLISGSEDKLIRIWDSKTSEFKSSHTLKGHSAGITKLVSFAEMKKFASASNDYTIRLWDSSNDYKTSVVIQAHSAKITSLLHFDNKLITSSTDKTIKVFDLLLNNKNISTLKDHTDGVNQLLIISTDPILLSASIDCSFASYSLEGQEEVKLIKKVKGHSMEITKLIELKGLIFSTIGKDKMIRVWDGNNEYKCICTIAAHKWEIFSLCFIEEYSLIYSCSQDKTIRGWEIKNWDDYLQDNSQMLQTKCIGVLKGHERDVIMVYALTNGNVMSVSNDLTLRIWQKG